MSYYCQYISFGNLDCIISFYRICINNVLGKLLSQFTGAKMAHISPYLLTTTEGGNVALPLYTSIVGLSYASNTIIFDIAGSLMAFVVMPIMGCKRNI